MESRKKQLTAPLLLSALFHGTAAVVAGWIIISHHKSPEPTSLAVLSSQTAYGGDSVQIQTERIATGLQASLLREQNRYIQSAMLTGLSIPSPNIPQLDRMGAPNALSTEIQKAVDGSLASGLPGLTPGTAFASATIPRASIPPPRFLGTPVLGDRILLLFDISRTVANAAARKGMPMEKIRDETIHLIQSLGIHTRFGIIQFARNYALFRPDLAASTKTNRNEAIDWLNRYFSTEGTLSRGVPNTVQGSPGFLIALKHAFNLDPDTLFILSDGNFQRGTGIHSNIPWEEIESTLDTLQKNRATPAKVHFIGIATVNETAETVRRILSRHGGTYSDLTR